MLRSPLTSCANSLAQLAGYKIPLRLEFVDALPRNPAGKVLKYQLAAQLTASPQGKAHLHAANRGWGRPDPGRAACGDRRWLC